MFPYGFSFCKLLNICFNREADMTKERIEKLLKAGANVILTTKGIDDMALKVRLKTNNFHSSLTQNSVFGLLSTIEVLNFFFFCFFFQYFVEAGAIAVRRVRKEDMRHVAKATGATLVLALLCFFNT